MRRGAGGAPGPTSLPIDFGMKRNIVTMLAASGCRVTVVPATTTAAKVLELEPDGLFLSNGPGDPAAVGYAVKNILGHPAAGLPTFGICLGHQLLGLGLRGPDGEAAVRPPGREPPGQGPARRARC